MAAYDSSYWNNKVDSINSTSNANFVKRLLDPNRQTIQDWEDSGSVATHKLSYVTDGKGNARVYPEVQEINGALFDFTDPKNKKTRKDAYDSAMKNGDYIEMSEEDAKWFTDNNYKKFYPSFKNPEYDWRTRAIERRNKSKEL